MCESLDGEGFRFRGCFRIWRQADGGVRACFYGDPAEHPLLPPDGLLAKMVVGGPVALVGGRAFEVNDFLTGGFYIRFFSESDAQTAVRLWAEAL